MIALDTNVLARLLAQGDPEQSKAARAFVDTSAQTTLVSSAAKSWRNSFGRWNALTS